MIDLSHRLSVAVKLLTDLRTAIRDEGDSNDDPYCSIAFNAILWNCDKSLKYLKGALSSSSSLDKHIEQTKTQ